jgi:spore germination protein KC
VNKLLKANCDALGIGRRLKVSHSELWKSIDWENKYKDVNLNPRIQIHIKSTGVIN